MNSGSRTTSRRKDVDNLQEKLKKFQKSKALLAAFLNNRHAQVDLVSVNHLVKPGTSSPISDPAGLFELAYECEFTGQYKSPSLFVVSVKTKRTDTADELAETSSSTEQVDQ